MARPRRLRGNSYIGPAAYFVTTCTHSRRNAFHDIELRERDAGVHRLWAELKQRHRCREILQSPNKMGIGLVHVE